MLEMNSYISINTQSSVLILLEDKELSNWIEQKCAFAVNKVVPGMQWRNVEVKGMSKEKKKKTTRKANKNFYIIDFW